MFSPISTRRRSRVEPGSSFRLAAALSSHTDLEALAEDARERFEALYERLPGWEVGMPQPALTELADLGLINGRILDAGCGSGENALFLAIRGFAVWGIDISPSAIGMAQAKARDRNQPAARFLIGDALRLETLGMTFDTVIDSGLFHALTDQEQRLYAASLHRVLCDGGLCHLLCFSDEEPGDTGPRRIRQQEICTAFAEGFEVLRIDAARFLTRVNPEGARAWLATVKKTL